MGAAVLWRSTMARLFLLTAWSLAMVWVFHSRAAAVELRHTRVAEGNVSQAVHLIWNRGLSGYTAVLRSDARQWGRIRPMHWIYQQAPFALTLLRNGDVWHSDPEVPLWRRLNGDLQTHTIFQMVVSAMALSVLGWVVWRISGMGWAAWAVAPLAASGASFSENLLVNYCDSVEIGQMLFIALYLLCILQAVMGKVPNPAREIAGGLFLVLAYGMKETTIVLFPAVGMTLALRLLLPPSASRAFRRFVLRHIALHVGLAALLLVLLRLHRTGGYVQHYQLGLDLWGSILNTWRVMEVPLEWIPFLSVGTLLVGIAHRVEWKRTGRLPPPAGGALVLATLLGLVAAGFFAVNVPWGVPLRKYALPSFWALASFVALLLALSTASLWRQGFRPAACLWACGALLFLAQGLPEAWGRERQFYRDQYGYRRAVPEVSEDLAKRLSSDPGIVRVRLVAGAPYQEGALPFLRTLNRRHEVNIARGGNPAESVRGIERNYFRRYSGRPAVELHLDPVFRGARDAEWVYVLDRRKGDPDAGLRAEGFLLEEEWWIHGAGRIARYGKGGGT